MNNSASPRTVDNGAGTCASSQGGVGHVDRVPALIGPTNCFPEAMFVAVSPLMSLVVARAIPKSVSRTLRQPLRGVVNGVLAGLTSRCSKFWWRA